MRRLLAIIPACAVLLAACGGGNDDDSTPPATPTIDANRLVGTEWVLVDLAGGGVISGVEATLQFQDLTRMGGNGSCNSFGANVRISGHAITVTDTMQTLIACEDDVAAQELHYMEALRKAERFAFDGDDLLIHASGFEAPLRFSPRTDASAAGTWETLPPLAAGIRQETAVVTLDDEVVVIGGFGANNSAQARVEAYNPSSRQWRRLPDLPVGMHHTNAAVVDGSIYIVGFLTGGNFAPDGRVFILRPGASQWGAGALMPAGTQRGASATVAIGQRIYVAGGLRGGAVADFSVYDTATDTWSELPDLPLRRDHFVGGAFGTKVVLAGGREGSITSTTGRVDVFDTERKEWSEGAPMPTPRGGTAGAVLDGKLYVFGGEGNTADPSGVFPQVEAYDVQTNTWAKLAPMRTPRHGTGATTLHGVIYVPGGATVQAFGAVDTVEAFAP